MNCFGIIAALSLIFRQENQGEAHSFAQISDDSVLSNFLKPKLAPDSFSNILRNGTIVRSKPAMTTIYMPGTNLKPQISELRSLLATRKAKITPEQGDRKLKLFVSQVVAKPMFRNLSFPVDIQIPLNLETSKSGATLESSSYQELLRVNTSSGTPKGFLESVSQPIQTVTTKSSGMPTKVAQGDATSRVATPKSDLKGPDFSSIVPPKSTLEQPKTTHRKELQKMESTAESASQFASLTTNLLTILETKMVNISVVGAPLRTIISSLSSQSGINVLLISKPEQEVTINMRGVSLNDALRHLSVVSGLKVVKVKNTVVIGEEAPLKSAYPKEYAAEYEEKAASKTETSTNKEAVIDPPFEPTKPKEVSKVITTKFLSAMNLANSLSAFLTKRNVSIVALPNTLIPMVNAGGGVGGGGMAAGAAGGAGGAAMGGGAAGGQAMGGGAMAGAGLNDPSLLRSRKLLIVGPSNEVDLIIQMIRDSDVPRKQVEITVTIHDVANDALKEEGFNWTLGSFSLTENNANSINFGSFSRTGLSFQSAMKGLENIQKAKLLASPNVTVMDGEQSTILVGERRQFPIVNGTTPQGQFIFSTQEQNVGISLQVAADIADDGTITMAVHPMVSSIIGFLQINGGSYPQISTRESSSTLTVKDGQTILMGGLLRDEEIKNFEQLPLLGKIPFFGELFKYRKTVRNNSQLVISITPRIIKTQ